MTNLRDVYVRGKYRDVILPMTVIRRLDSLLEASKPKVLDLKAKLEQAKNYSPWGCFMFRCRLRFLQCLAVHAEGACRKNEKPDARIRLHRIS